MKVYTSDEIQQISSNFRGIARRLLRTDVPQCDANLKRFMAFIENNELIKDFIDKNNIKTYNIPQIRKERGHLNPFEISPISSEEIAFEYQLLKYSVDQLNGNFTNLYFPWYINSKATPNDSAHDFISHIIDPLVDYISDYLRQMNENALKAEGRNNSTGNNTVNASYSTVVLNSSTAGSISNNVSIENGTKANADDIIQQIEAALPEYKDQEDISDIAELLSDIKEELSQGKKPKRPVLTAFKTVGSGFVKIAPLAIKLWEILG